jgi:hypothetical protein
MEGFYICFWVPFFLFCNKFVKSSVILIFFSGIMEYNRFFLMMINIPMCYIAMSIQII